MRACVFGEDALFFAKPTKSVATTPVANAKATARLQADDCHNRGHRHKEPPRTCVRVWSHTGPAPTAPTGAFGNQKRLETTHMQGWPKSTNRPRGGITTSLGFAYSTCSSRASTRFSAKTHITKQKMLKTPNPTQPNPPRTNLWAELVRSATNAVGEAEKTAVLLLHERTCTIRPTIFFFFSTEPKPKDRHLKKNKRQAFKIASHVPVQNVRAVTFHRLLAAVRAHAVPSGPVSPPAARRCWRGERSAVWGCTGASPISHSATLGKSGIFMIRPHWRVRCRPGLRARNKLILKLAHLSPCPRALRPLVFRQCLSALHPCKGLRTVSEKGETGGGAPIACSEVRHLITDFPRGTHWMCCGYHRDKPGTKRGMNESESEKATERHTQRERERGRNERACRARRRAITA